METLTVKEAVEQLRELKLADRCDRHNPSAQAFVIAWKEINGKEMDLMFCGHCYAEFEPKLAMQGWNVLDDRHKINEKPQIRDEDDETF